MLYVFWTETDELKSHRTVVEIDRAIQIKKIIVMTFLLIFIN